MRSTNVKQMFLTEENPSRYQSSDQTRKYTCFKKLQFSFCYILMSQTLIPPPSPNI